MYILCVQCMWLVFNSLSKKMKDIERYPVLVVR